MIYAVIISICIFLVCLYFFTKDKEEWCIEYRPHFDRYYPKYKGRYLAYWSIYKNYRTEDCIGNAACSKTEEGAREIIKNVKEYWGNSSNVKIIKL